MAFGSGLITVPSRTIASSLGLGRTDLRRANCGYDCGRAGRSPGAGPRGETIASRAQGQLAHPVRYLRLMRGVLKVGLTAFLGLAAAMGPISEASAALPATTVS